MSKESQREPSGAAALLVGTGIFLSRVLGLVRARGFSHYFGAQSAAFAAYNAGQRIPNFLQNLLGEGVLSASFIPVYSQLLAKGEREEAERVAGAVFGLLSLVVTILCIVGVFAAPLLVDIIVGGLQG